MTTIKEALKFGKNFLKEYNIQTAQIDTRVLLQKILEKSYENLLMQYDEEIDEAQFQKFISLLELRKNHFPIAYLIGTKEFYGRDFNVNENVLIPRPESELLIDEALKIFSKKDKINILDLGTGSGCLGLTLLAEIPNANATLVEKSIAAIEVAKTNCKKLNLTKRCKIIQSDWFSSLQNCSKKFDLIICNPPYISLKDERVNLEAQHEPASALYSEKNGMQDICHIVNDVKQFLSENATLLMEFGSGDEQVITDIFQKAGFSDLYLKKDLADINRIIVAKL